MGEFRMPSLGAEMESAVLVEWYVKPGDRVERGDIVAVVETYKGAIEIEVFEPGVVEELVAEEGTRVPVGGRLARIRAEEGAGAVGAPAPEPSRAPEERLRASPAARRRAAELAVELEEVEGSGPDGAILLADVEAAAAEAEGPPAEPAAGARAPGEEAPARRVRVTPLARKVAEEAGVDLATVEGTGIGGAITRRDVERASAAGPGVREEAPAGAGAPPSAPPAPPVETGAPERPRAAAEPDEMRKAIAAAVARSKREIPHYYLASRIDMSRALTWLEEANRERPMAERLLPAALQLKAVALALHAAPDLNGFWRDGAFRPSADVHVGVAISLRSGGLVVPAIHHADRKSPDEMMAALRDLVTRARSGRLRGSELSDATITVTNLGDRGVETVFGIIYPPQVALVGFGRIEERPWAEDGLVGARPVVDATLSADHRASDGHRGGLFLAALEHLLGSPGEL